MSDRRTWIAASLAGADTEQVRGRMHALRPWIDAVEVRLDLIPQFDLRRLLAASPLPVIVTYRPAREGGRYRGDEAHRLYTLQQAATMGATAIDVEWDASPALPSIRPALRIVSRHFFHEFPDNLKAEWHQVAKLAADVVKLAVYVHTLTEALHVCRLYKQVDRPTIAIAMGRAGLISRLIAPFYPQAFLTFGAASQEGGVAPGQISVQKMREHFHVHRLHPGTRLDGYIGPDAVDSYRIARFNQRWQARGEDRVILPLEPTPEDTLEEIVEMAWHLGFKGLWIVPPFAGHFYAGSESIWMTPSEGARLIKNGEIP